MKVTLTSVMLTMSLVAGTNSALSAQSKTIPGDIATISATVEAIDATTRTLTVKNSQGNLVPIMVPKSVERFSEIKVGDTISARYYDNIVLRVKPAGEAAVDTTAANVTKGTGAAPVATAAMQRTITATIVAIDSKVPSIAFKGEKVNWTYCRASKTRRPWRKSRSAIAWTSPGRRR